MIIDNKHELEQGSPISTVWGYLKKYVKGDSRNKIIFSRSRIDGLTYIDVGAEMSKIMGSSPVEISGIETFYRQIFNQTSLSDDIGPYLAIENIGILFEPDMHLNLESIFDTYSKGEVLIVNAPGEIIDDKFHFYYPESNFTIDLKGLSFIDCSLQNSEFRAIRTN